MKEIVRYGIVDEHGSFLTSYYYENTAIESIFNKKGCTIVKLVGQMPEPKKMKKVATYAYRYLINDVTISGVAITEERAKTVCKERGWELILWPYGPVLEVEE